LGNLGCIRPRKPSRYATGSLPPIGRCWNGARRAPDRALLVLTALLLQAMLEFVVDSRSGGFGRALWAPLGRVDGRARSGWVAGRPPGADPTSRAAVIGATIVACCVVLTTSHVIGIVVDAQVLLVLLVVAVSIPITGRLHHAVPSTIRAGVASGDGTLTWLTFLPFALLFGAVSDRSGIHDAGWTLGAVAVITVVLLAWTVRGFMRSPAGVPLQLAFAADQFRPDGDLQWPGHWVDPSTAWEQTGVQIDTDATVAEVRKAMTDLPSPQHDVVVARDVEGRSPAEVREELDLSRSDERDLLNQARGRVRARLDDYFEEDGK
jgi:hypothetical protein